MDRMFPSNGFNLVGPHRESTHGAHAAHAHAMHAHRLYAHAIHAYAMHTHAERVHAVHTHAEQMLAIGTLKSCLHRLPLRLCSCALRSPRSMPKKHWKALYCPSQQGGERAGNRYPTLGLEDPLQTGLGPAAAWGVKKGVERLLMLVN